MRLKLQELQKIDPKVQKLKQDSEDYKETDGILYYQSLSFVPEVIKTKITSHYYNNLSADQFGIKKTRTLVACKNYQATFWHDVKAYVQSFDVCLASKIVRYKPYDNLQSLLVLTHYSNDQLIDWVTGLLISTNWKGEA